jgi:hypothetical protein
LHPDFETGSETLVWLLFSSPLALILVDVLARHAVGASRMEGSLGVSLYLSRIQQEIIAEGGTQTSPSLRYRITILSSSNPQKKMAIKVGKKRYRRLIRQLSPNTEYIARRLDVRPVRYCSGGGLRARYVLFDKKQERCPVSDYGNLRDNNVDFLYTGTA